MFVVSIGGALAFLDRASANPLLPPSGTVVSISKINTCDSRCISCCPTKTPVPPTKTPKPTKTQKPTKTPKPTATDVPPTATEVPPTATDVPPTATDVPPTATDVPPTATDVPPTATDVPPTATDVPPTATEVPPTATDVPPTATDIPPTATDVPPEPTGTDVPPEPTGTNVPTKAPQKSCGEPCLVYSLACDTGKCGSMEFCDAITPIEGVKEIYTIVDKCPVWRDCTIEIPKDLYKVYATGLVPFVAKFGEEIKVSHYDGDLNLEVIFDLPVNKDISYFDLSETLLTVEKILSCRGYPPLFKVPVICE